MRGALLLLPLLMAGCSCHRDPTTAEAEASASAAAREDAATKPPAPGADGGMAASAGTEAVTPGALPPAQVVRAYVSALPAGDRQRLDRYWLHPPAGRSADDATLRALQNIVTLRVQTDRPVPRDDLRPSRLIEVPVDIRVVTADSRLRFRGWYRVVPDSQGQQWKLHAAQVQPVLD